MPVPQKCCINLGVGCDPGLFATYVTLFGHYYLSSVCSGKSHSQETARLGKPISFKRMLSEKFHMISKVHPTVQYF